MYFCFKSVCINRGLNLWCSVLSAWATEITYFCLTWTWEIDCIFIQWHHRKSDLLEKHFVKIHNKWGDTFCSICTWAITTYVTWNSCKVRWQVIYFPAKETQSQSDRQTHSYEGQVKKKTPGQKELLIFILLSLFLCYASNSLNLHSWPVQINS